MNQLCEAIHPKFRVYCGLEKGHHTDHVAMIGETPEIWPNNDHDEERVARIAINVVLGLLVVGAVLSFACGMLIAAG